MIIIQTLIKLTFNFPGSLYQYPCLRYELPFNKNKQTNKAAGRKNVITEMTHPDSVPDFFLSFTPLVKTSYRG